MLNVMNMNRDNIEIGKEEDTKNKQVACSFL